MDLNSIKLPAHLIEELYGNSLVQVNAGGERREPELIDFQSSAGKWKSLGNNQKHILILLSNPGIPYLTDTELQFLTSILTACKLGMNDVAIVNLSGYENADYKELIEYFKSRIVLLFDIEPASFGLPMKFPHYQIQPFASCSFLYAPSLKTLEANRDEKTKLWTALKRLFNI